MEIMNCVLGTWGGGQQPKGHLVHGKFRIKKKGTLSIFGLRSGGGGAYALSSTAWAYDYDLQCMCTIYALSIYCEK